MKLQAISIDSIGMYLRMLVDKILLRLPEMEAISLRNKLLVMHNIELHYTFHRNRDDKSEWLNNDDNLFAQDKLLFLELFDMYGNYELESSIIQNGIYSMHFVLNDEDKKIISYKAFEMYNYNSIVCELKNNLGYNISYINFTCDIKLLNFQIYGISDKNVYFSIFENRSNTKVVNSKSVLLENTFLCNEFKDVVFEGYGLVYLTNLEWILKNGITNFNKIIMNTEDVDIEELFKKYNVEFAHKNLIFYCNLGSGLYKSSINKVSKYISSLSYNLSLSIEIYNVLEENGKVYTINTNLMKKFGVCKFYTDYSNFTIKNSNNKLIMNKKDKEKDV